jgi:hypothetical protein
MGLNESSIGADGQLTGLESNVFDEFPDDVMETLHSNYFYMYSTNFDWNAKSNEFKNNGQYDGAGFAAWKDKHEQSEIMNNLDKIISAVRSDLLLLRRRVLADKKLVAFEELIKPVFGNNITGNVLSKFEEEILLNPYATVQDIERGFQEAKQLIDQEGNIDSRKMEKSTIFTGNDINIPNFERFVVANPQYKKTFDVWGKLNDESTDLLLRQTNAHHIVGYDKLRKLYDFLISFRRGSIQESDIPYAEELPLDNQNDLQRGISVCDKAIKEADQYINTVGSAVFNTVTISAIYGDSAKFIDMLHEMVSFKKKIEGYYNQYYDLIDGYDNEFGVGNIPQSIKLKYDILDRMVSMLDNKIQDLAQIHEVLGEMIDKVKHMSQYAPHLLQIKNNEIGNPNLPAVQ